MDVSLSLVLESCWSLGLAATCLAIGVALLVDHYLGEPSARWHPVVWMGKYLQHWGDRIAPSAEAMGQDATDGVCFAKGGLAWTWGALWVTAAAAVLQWVLLHWLSWPWVGLLAGVLLKPLLAWRMLHDEVAAVESALSETLQAGRDRLGWLCSRDVSGLGAVEVRETALETLAENLNDSVIAPLFWFAVGGLPAAALYRWANTADAMWGYRGVRQGRVWTWAGKWAARADDVLSWLPARLTGLALMLAGRSGSWRQWALQARQTPSPNGGWPMAAMALVLDVRLSKPGVYTLHAGGHGPTSADSVQGLGLANALVWTIGVCAFAGLLFSVWMGV